MKRPLILAACLGLAAIAGAQEKAPARSLTSAVSEVTPSAPIDTSRAVSATILSQVEDSGTTTLVIDIGGEQSWDLLSDASNTVLRIALPPGTLMNGIGWDVNLTTVGGSWLSEARFYFDGSDQDFSGLFLTPGVGDNFAGSDAYSSPVLAFRDIGITDIEVQADGFLYIQLFEGFDDVADAVDADWVAPSSLTITYDAPAPVPTMTEWGLIVLGVALLGGVLFMTMRRRPTHRVAPAFATE